MTRAQEAVFWFITVRRPDGCAPWGLEKNLDAVVNNLQDAFDRRYQFAFNPNDRTKAFLNVDHAYKIKFLKEFFTYMLEGVQEGPQCTEFKNFWDKINHASTFENWENSPKNYFYRALGAREGITRAATMFRILPSAFPNFSEFIGVDAEVNTWKGNLLFKGLPDIRQSLVPGEPPSHWIDVLTYMAVAIDFIHHPDVIKAFRTTNSRIQRTSEKISLSQCHPPEDYGVKYQQWMVDRLNDQARQINDL